jgi:hypothetical protein
MYMSQVFICSNSGNSYLTVLRLDTKILIPGLPIGIRIKVIKHALTFQRVSLDCRNVPY